MIKKICVATMGYESLSIRGITDFEDSLRMYGETYEVFYLKWSNAKQVTSNNICRVTYRKKIPKSINNLNYLINFAWYMISNPKLDLYIIDDVALLGFISTSFAKILKNKTMVTIHGFYEEEWNIMRIKHKNLKIEILRFLSNFTLKNVDLIVINDDRMKELLMEKGICEQNIFKRYVFVDTDLFNRNRIKNESVKVFMQKLELPESYVLFVGYLEKEEGLLDALAIFKQTTEKLPKCNYVILGHGILENELQKFIKENPHIQITFIKHVDFTQMNLIYYNASVVLLPMYPPQAGIGRIILEALSMEKPVITTDIGIFNKVVIDNFNGFRINLGDIDTMSQKLHELLTNADTREKMGKNGRKIAVKYSLNKYIQNWIKCLNFISKFDKNLN